MKRRAFLAGGATAVASASALTGCAHASSPNSPSNPPPSDQPLPPGDLDGAAAKLRAKYITEFGDADYVDNVVLPSFFEQHLRRPASRASDDRRGADQGERAALRHVGSAESELETSPRRRRHGVSRGWRRETDNRRKRIYMSAVTPDLYQGKYQQKVVGFFDQLFAPANANKPLMRIYLNTFWISTGICIWASKAKPFPNRSGRSARTSIRFWRTATRRSESSSTTTWPSARTSTSSRRGSTTD